MFVIFGEFFVDETSYGFFLHGDGSSGVAQDDFGIADISDLVIANSDMRFTKQYRPEGSRVDAATSPLYYWFRKTPDSRWIGTYREGSIAGCGDLAWCILVDNTKPLSREKLRKYLSADEVKGLLIID